MTTPRASDASGRVRTGHSGVFKVRVDGDLVLDAQQAGFDLSLVHKAIDERLPA